MVIFQLHALAQFTAFFFLGHAADSKNHSYYFFNLKVKIAKTTSFIIEIDLYEYSYTACNVCSFFDTGLI